jgi:hypothetical protein
MFSSMKVALYTALLFCLLLPGCVSRAWMAGRVADKMTRASTSPRDELRLRHELISLTPESDRYLARAFFPIGLYDVPLDAVPGVAAAGFNLILNADTTPAYLDRASAAGLRVIPYIRQDCIPVEVAEAADKDIFAWYLMDEPDLNAMPPEQYRALAQTLRRQDKERPIFLTVWAPDRYDDFISSADILAANPYPIRSMDPVENHLQSVARTLDMACATAGNRPVWVILQAFWAEPIWARNPTPPELACMAHLALNHGATGVIYFSYNSGDKTLPEHVELWKAITGLNARIAALRAALLVPPDREAVRIHMVDEEPPEGAIFARPPLRRIALDAALRPYRGAHLLTIVNPDPWSKRALIALPKRLPGAIAAELFIEYGAPLTFPCALPVELSFEPFQVRQFWIERKE